MITDKETEKYIIERFGLTKKQIKEMTMGEVKEYREKIIRREIDDLGIYRPDDNKK